MDGCRSSSSAEGVIRFSRVHTGLLGVLLGFRMHIATHDAGVSLTCVGFSAYVRGTSDVSLWYIY
jgi:hypothetical protein